MMALLVGRKLFLDNSIFKKNNLLLTKGRNSFHADIYQNLRRPVNQIVNCRCYSNSRKPGGGRFKYEILNSIERSLDRIWARWLYFRYEGTLGPQPESFTVKQQRKGNIINACIIIVLMLIFFFGQNFNPLNTSPLIVGVKIWPDNIEEYRDLLNVKNGKVSSSKSSLQTSTSSSSPTAAATISP